MVWQSISFPIVVGITVALLNPTNADFNDDVSPEEERHSFRDFKLVRINPETEENLLYLKSLYDGPSPYELDFWQPPTRIGGIVDVTVTPSDAPIFVKDLESKNLNYIVALNDLEQAIVNERSEDLYHHPQEGFAYDRYNSLDDIHKELKRLKRENPDMVTLIDIGESHENRTLLLIKLTGRRNPMGGKVSMWIDAGIHAREWIAPATAMNIIKELITGYEKDPTIQKLMDHIEFYILPVMNPDGYEYSRLKNRMWRKNRRPATCRRRHFHSTLCCAGVDLNRNFDWFWGSAGASNDPCHETYGGPQSFSEPESMAVRDFLEENTPQAFITLHSYSQMWLIPYGHRKRSYPQDFHTALRPLALRATKALYEVYGTKYQVGTGADLMYEASGGSHDWAKGQLNVPYAYLIELRPKNSLMGHGFLLPEREIPATGIETFEAIKVVADELVAQFVEPIIRNKMTTPVPTVPTVRRGGYNLISTTPGTSSTSSSSVPQTTTPLLTPSSSPVTSKTSSWMPVVVTFTTSTSSKAPTTSSSSTTTTTVTSPTTTSTQTATQTTTQTTTEPSTSTEAPTTTINVVTTSFVETTEKSKEKEKSSSEEEETNPPPTSTPLIGLPAVTRRGPMIPVIESVTPVLPIEPPEENIRCLDYGSYCRLWGILQLCDRPQVQRLCTKTCNRACII
ncbi:hypothetical protein WR25_08318 [Diploscapter pachys]|uniref:Peptidase M14 domain-containing protein n=1 Tax=Diploscapter pachys TaxID=2018661 RepID=A0A2A2KZT0_9BILA|nr:hypothetical protein WR25_08318 [Diploscapter pachys]